MQACIDNSEFSQIDCYDVLQSIQTLVSGGILNVFATKFLRNSLIAGYLFEVKCVAQTLQLLLELESSREDLKQSSPGGMRLSPA